MVRGVAGFAMSASHHAILRRLPRHETEFCLAGGADTHFWMKSTPNYADRNRWPEGPFSSPNFTAMSLRLFTTYVMMHILNTCLKTRFKTVALWR